MRLIYHYRQSYLPSIFFILLSFKYAYGDDIDGVIKLYDLNEPFELNCTMDVDVYVSQYDWSINGAFVSASTKGVELLENGAILRVVRAREDDFGYYTCNIGGVVLSAWRAEPRTHSRIQGEVDLTVGVDFEITCDLTEKRSGTVVWLYTFHNESIVNVSLGRDSRFSVKNSAQGVPGGVLVGRSGEPSDAGLYTCVPLRYGPSASTVLQTASATWWIYLVCVLAVVLIALIIVAFIYRNRIKHKCLGTAG